MQTVGVDMSIRPLLSGVVSFGKRPHYSISCEGLSSASLLLVDPKDGISEQLHALGCKWPRCKGLSEKMTWKPGDAAGLDARA